MQLFDPLELLSPVVQKGRHLVQLLWRLKCKWDEPLFGPWAQAANLYATMLLAVHELHISRCIRGPLAVAGWEIACFMDASSHTMAGCLYHRTLYAGGVITTHLICSKMKLVPVRKQESIPRAETQAGLIGVKLAFDLATAYGFDMRKILDRTQLSQWLHVSTKENPTEAEDDEDVAVQVQRVERLEEISAAFHPAPPKRQPRVGSIFDGLPALAPGTASTFGGRP